MANNSVALGNVISMKGTKCVLSQALKNADKHNVRELGKCLLAFYADDLSRLQYKADKAAAKKAGKELPAMPAICEYDSVPCGKAARNAYRKDGAKGFFQFFGIELTEEAYKAFDESNSVWSVNTVSKFSETRTLYRRKKDFRSFMVDVAVTLAMPTNGKLINLPQ